MTKSELEELIAAIAPVIRGHIDQRLSAPQKGPSLDAQVEQVIEAAKSFVVRSLKSSNEKIAALEAKVAALEQRPAMSYRGTFDGGLSEYRAADVVSYKGQLWYCMKTTTGRPGETNDWRLMFKREDGR